MYMSITSLLLMLHSSTVVFATDLTRDDGAAGNDVVKAVLSLVHESCVFQNDFLFLRRWAHVASGNGNNLATYRTGFHGGIWQISENDWKSTVNMHTTEIQNAFNIDWTQTSWKDLRKPLYSGIAAMLTLERLSSIPRDLQGQAQHYSTHMSGSAADFTSRVATMIDCETGELDMAFVLDASGSVSSADFRRSMQFTADVIGGFNVGNNFVRVALVSYSSGVYNHFGFLDHSTTQSAQTDALAIPKHGGTTATNRALDNLRTNVFTSQKGSRQNAARIAIILTDGRSNDRAATIKAAQELRDEGVIVFAIGLGSGVNVDELNSIASKPTCTHVRFLDNFSELDSIISDIKNTACKTAVVISQSPDDAEPSTTFQCSQQRTIQIVLHPETTIMTRPEIGKVEIFGSFKITEPNAAFFDFHSEASDHKPSLIYVAGTQEPLYISVVGELDLGDNCTSTYVVKIVAKNDLQKTGASNTCVKNSQSQECTDLDIVKGANSKDVKPGQDQSSDIIAAICASSPEGYYSHPDTMTKYLYCGPGGEVLEVTCPPGLAYLESLQDCVTPVSTCPDAACNACTEELWERGFRKFPFATSYREYVNCTGVLTCQIADCGPASKFVTEDQACQAPGQPGMNTNPQQPKNYNYLCSRAAIDYLFYHPHPTEPTHYIQCDMAGIAYDRVCASGTVWKQQFLTCVHAPPSR